MPLNLTIANAMSQPLIIPFGSALFGGLITFAGVLLAQKLHNQREERNRDYELKKETFNEVLSTVVELNHFLSENSKISYDMIAKFRLMHYKLAICNATEVQNIIYEKFSDPEKMKEIITINDELISAMKRGLNSESALRKPQGKEEANKKGWWQFWKTS